MLAYFDNNAVLHLVPENGEGAMAMRYWHGEYQEHGDKMLMIHMDVPEGKENPKSRHHDDD